MYANRLLIKETNRIKVLMSEQIFLGGPAMGLTSPKNVTKTIDWMKSWDKHDWLNFVEITSSLLAMIPQPASPITSPILLGVSTAAGVANAVGYFKEGDKYTAGLILAFSIIPAGELIKSLRQSKVFMALGPKKSAELINKIKSKTATSTEIKMGQELVKELGPKADELAKQTTQYTIKEILKKLPKMSFEFILKLCIGMSKLGVFGIKQGIILAGTFLTYDEIYKALNYKNEKNLSNRDKNNLVKQYQKIMNNEEEIKESMIRNVWETTPKILEHSNSFIKIDTTYKVTF